MGALLAVPATLLVKSLMVDHSSSGRWFGALIDADPTEGGQPARRPGASIWKPGKRATPNGASRRRLPVKRQ